jgi:hypothetical protein
MYQVSKLNPNFPAYREGEWRGRKIGPFQELSGHSRSEAKRSVKFEVRYLRPDSHHDF